MVRVISPDTVALNSQFFCTARQQRHRTCVVTAPMSLASGLVKYRSDVTSYPRTLYPNSALRKERTDGKARAR